MYVYVYSMFMYGALRGKCMYVWGEGDYTSHTQSWMSGVPRGNQSTPRHVHIQVGRGLAGPLRALRAHL